MIGKEHEQQLMDSLDFYGLDNQRQQLTEELAELITALSHHRRGRVDRRAVLNEASDVSIVLVQILMGLFGPEWRQRLEEAQACGVVSLQHRIGYEFEDDKREEDTRERSATSRHQRACPAYGRRCSRGSGGGTAPCSHCAWLGKGKDNEATS